MKKPKYTAAAIVVVTMCALSLPVQMSAQSTWAGGPGAWSNPALWCPAGVPPSGVNVSIGNCKNGNPSVVTDDVTATINNLTIASGNSLSIAGGIRLTMNGGTISNAGTLNLAGTSTSGAQLGSLAATTTFSGAGTVFINDTPNNLFFGSPGTTLVNQTTIRGAGSFGGIGSLTLNNQATVDAQGTNPMMFRLTSGTSLNTGTLQASNGGTLQLILGTSGPTLNNAGGTIKALTGSIVQLRGIPVAGGTLTTAGTGLIEGLGGTIADLTNSGVFQIGGVTGGGSANERLTGTINNTGTIRIGSASWGDDITSVDGTVTLTGGGTVNFANSIESMVGGVNTPTLVNTNNTISGTGTMGGGGGLALTNSGTVDANASTPLLLVLSMTNTGTMQASNGGELRTQGDINNTGGTIKALDASKVTLFSNTIKGGTLTTSGSGVIQTAPTQPTLDGITNTGMLLIPNNGQVNLLNTITNGGTIFLDSTGGPVSFRIGNAVTFAGHGTITMSDEGIENFWSGGGGSSAVSNFDNLIQGSGQISVPFTNQKKGVVLANLTNPLQFNQAVTNLGTFQVNQGSSLLIPSATWTNFANNIVTGGTYIVGGRFTFGVPGNFSIVTNSANIQLTSPTAQITISGTNANALANFNTNTKKGQLTVTGKAALTTTPSFTNDGKVTIAAKSNFTVGGSYTQTSAGTGTTKVDGTLTAPTGVSLQGGTVFGKGTIAAAVTNAASVTAGDTVKAAGKLSINGSYTQQAAGSLNVQIGGLAAGSKYSQLAVSNGVSLNGTLNIALIKGFIPAIGDTFTIVTASARTGQFATVNGLSINSGEHFQITYTPNSVQLQVVSGP